MPPSHDDSENGRQIDIHRYAAVVRLVRSPGSPNLSQFGVDVRLRGQFRLGNRYPPNREWAQRADNFALDRLVRLFCWPLADLTGGHGQLNGLHESVCHYVSSFEGENKVSLNSALGL